MKKTAYLELYKGKGQKTLKSEPTLMWKKPSKRELANSQEFGYKLYEVEIKIGKEVNPMKKHIHQWERTKRGYKCKFCPKELNAQKEEIKN